MILAGHTGARPCALRSCALLRGGWVRGRLRGIPSSAPLCESLSSNFAGIPVALLPQCCTNSDLFIIDGLSFISQLFRMSTTLKTDSVRFTTRGQVVIPSWLRKEFHIEDGTRCVVQSTAEGILLKPVTKHAIARLRGILKRKPGDKPFSQEWKEHKAAEIALEDAKYARSSGSR